MSGNTFGAAFRVTTFGESHGPYIGVVIDGVQPGLAIDAAEIQAELDRRKPGQSAIVTQRNEADRMEIISGVFEGKTTGTPICMLIRNTDHKPKDYSALANVLRPGHASYTYLKKYGVFDYRGGGRASGRETATRTAAGAVAKQFLRRRGIEIHAYVRQVGDIRAEQTDLAEIERNPVRAPDAQAAAAMERIISKARDEGDSLGGIVEAQVHGVPPGLGEPVFHKIEADLAGALMSIGAVKGFEIGSGFDVARMKGSENNDAYHMEDGNVRTRTNNAGGVLAGITNGEDIVVRVAVKPPSSIRTPQETVDSDGNAITLETQGRHDPCICPRVVPAAEAMIALTLIDHVLMQERSETEDSGGSIEERIETIDLQMLLLLAQRRHLQRKANAAKTLDAAATHNVGILEFPSPLVNDLGLSNADIEALHRSLEGEK